MRVAVTVEGEADHAGTTRREERRDALAAAARVIVAAEELARGDAFVVTPTRMLVEPNALTTIAARVRCWLDARAPAIGDVDAWRAGLEQASAAIGAERRVTVSLATASRSPGVRFDDRVRAALSSAPGAVPDVVCFAGHDAGILAERIPAGMVLVRNRTGVSHHPDEHVELDDAAVAARAVAAAVEALA
jgi:N-carbamoyl-L-amino-acid hydrolase